MSYYVVPRCYAVLSVSPCGLCRRPLEPACLTQETNNSERDQRPAASQLTASATAAQVQSSLHRCCCIAPHLTVSDSNCRTAVKPRQPVEGLTDQYLSDALT
jgi:hypothetical protein